MKTKSKIACYVRTTNLNESVNDQIHEIEKYFNGLPIQFGNTTLFVDENISGNSTIEERTALNKLTEKIESGEVKTLVVHKIDRLFRNHLQLLKFNELLKEHDVSLISVNESFNTGTATGRLVIEMMFSVAEHERQMMKARGGKCCCGE